MGKRATTKSESRKGMLIVSLILLVLCTALLVRYYTLKRQYQENMETIALLEEDKAAEDERTQQLQQQEAYQQTDAFVEETARKLLNLIKPGDTTIKPREGE